MGEACAYGLVFTDRIENDLEFASSVLGVKCRAVSDNTLWEMTEHLDRAYCSAIYDGLKQSPFWALTIDDTTLTDSQTVASIILHYITPDWQLRISLLRLSYVDSGTGSNVYQAVCEVFMKAGFGPTDMKRLVFLGADGASAMQGSANGLLGQLRRVCPRLHAFHCATHKVSLVAKSIVASFPLLKAVDHVMRTCFNVFSNSPMRVQQLRYF